jgi:hypothetical protein
MHSLQKTSRVVSSTLLRPQSATMRRSVPSSLSSTSTFENLTLRATTTKHTNLNHKRERPRTATNRTRQQQQQKQSRVSTLFHPPFDTRNIKDPSLAPGRDDNDDNKRQRRPKQMEDKKVTTLRSKEEEGEEEKEEEINGNDDGENDQHKNGTMTTGRLPFDSDSDSDSKDASNVITFGDPSSSSSAAYRMVTCSKLKMSIMQHILQREECINDLLIGIRDHVDAAEIFSLLAPLRLCTLAVVETIVEWKKKATTSSTRKREREKNHRSFQWQGQSYLLKVRINRCICV